MLARFLLDTNVMSEPTKPEPNLRVINRLDADTSLFATAAVAYHELIFGYLRMAESRKKQEVEAYIRRNIRGILQVLPYCEAAAVWHANERIRLSKQGKTPPYVDGQIAAIAAVNNLILVTRNVADFQNFQDLKIENWFE